MLKIHPLCSVSRVYPWRRKEEKLGMLGKRSLSTKEKRMDNPGKKKCLGYCWYTALRGTRPVLKAEARPAEHSTHSRYSHSIREPGRGRTGPSDAVHMVSTRATRPWSRVDSLWCLEPTYLPTRVCPVPLTGALSSGALLSSGTACSSASEGRPLVPECWLQGSFTGVWPWVLLLQQSYSLLEHSHLGLVSLHHGHHLRLQLLQFVLMLLLRFLISSH